MRALLYVVTIALLLLTPLGCDSAGLGDDSEDEEKNRGPIRDEDDAQRVAEAIYDDMQDFEDELAGKAPGDIVQGDSGSAEIVSISSSGDYSASPDVVSDYGTKDVTLKTQELVIDDMTMTGEIDYYNYSSSTTTGYSYSSDLTINISGSSVAIVLPPFDSDGYTIEDTISFSIHDYNDNHLMCDGDVESSTGETYSSWY